MPDEPKYAVPRQLYHALASKVLVVLSPGTVGDWAAYCDAVPGIRHSVEWQEVAEQGCKLEKSLAVVMFPQFDPEMYRSG